MRTIILTLCSFLLLTGCGSSPKTNFYTLSVASTGTRGRTTSSPVQLAAVHIPPSLDRRQMVRLTNENQVKISETDRWSGPFDEMVRNILSQDLAALLPAGRVILPQAPPPAGTATLVVTLAEFGPDANGQVRLSGSWALLGGNSGSVLKERVFHLDGGPAPTAEATAAAMSQSLGQLAGAIASNL